jgi:hypothetical protein
MRRPWITTSKSLLQPKVSAQALPQLDLQTRLPRNEWDLAGSSIGLSNSPSGDLPVQWPKRFTSCFLNGSTSHFQLTIIPGLQNSAAAIGGFAAAVVVSIAVFVIALVLYLRRKRVGHTSSSERTLISPSAVSAIQDAVA